MKTYRVEVSQMMNAPADVVYNILRDYNETHPAILPPQFTNLLVHEGGEGAGTKIEVHMEVMGQKTVMHMHITEPQPRRVLVETDVNTGTVTTFTVNPIADTQQCQLTITTDFVRKAGIGGMIEQFLTPYLTRGIYEAELQNINTYAQELVTA